VPQGVKPLLEAWTNYSFFTGRELEGIYQKQQDPSLRRASNTSELAIAIANFSK
jgi:ACR3 family arsenite efflux pump ArsB